MLFACFAFCQAADLQGQTFTDVTLPAGIDHVQATSAAFTGLNSSRFLTGGVATGDFDGDGWTDLVFTRLRETDLFYKNLGDGTFERRSSTAGFTDATLTNGLASGDIDHDGDQDLYITGASGETRNYLYLNDGNGFFTDAGVTRTVVLANGTERNGQGVSFGDYNNDGYLDLVTADWGNPVADSQSRLFENRGGVEVGLFDDVTAAAGIAAYRKADTERFSPRLIDLDRDGHLDLPIASDFETSQLFWSNGDGTFTDGTLASGVGTDYNGMGSTFGDYDSDGDLDWFITNITSAPGIPTPFGGWNRLYRNDGNRQFTDVTLEAGVRDSRWSWGTSFFDYDNDGDLDLIATNGYNGPGFTNDRTYLWRNDDGVFTDISDEAGITDTRQGRGLAHLDYDNDGDLDLVIVNNKDQPILYRNDGGNTNDFLRLELQGTVSNRDAIGAFLTVTPDLDTPEKRMVWEIDGGSSFLSQNERIAHFGLGQSDGVVDLVTIEWTSGIVQHLRSLDANQLLGVTEAEVVLLPGDVDFSGVLDAADIDWIRAAINQPALYRSLFALEPMDVADLTGDGNVDSGDLDYFVYEMMETSYGDFNLDGVVDLADFARWQLGYVEQASSYASGDFDGDGDVDGADFLQLQQSINSLSQAQTASSRIVPEPAAIALLAIALTGCLGGHRRRH